MKYRYSVGKIVLGLALLGFHYLNAQHEPAPIPDPARLAALRKELLSPNLDAKTRDDVALEFVKLNPKSRILVVFPLGVGYDKEIKKVIQKYGTLLYEKHIQLNAVGAFNFTKYVYYNNRWFGINGSMLDKVKRKSNLVFPANSSNPARIYLIEQFNPDYYIFKNCKNELREIVKNRRAVHSDHRYSAAIRFAQAVFNDNSIKFFNTRTPQYLLNMELLLQRFEICMQEYKINPDNCCIVGHAVSAVYGKQDSAQIEFVYNGPLGHLQKLIQGNQLKNKDNDNDRDHYYIINVNRRAKKSGNDIRALVTESQNHFYYHGFKFAAAGAYKNSGKERRR